MKQKISWFSIGLIISFALSAVAHFTPFSEMLQFILSAVAILFAAGFLGKATESTAHYAGQRIGGFLNATLGNAAELIIAIFLVKDGLFEMVKASITGSIIGNLLLVLGISVVTGGLKYREQRFNVALASHSASLMILAVIALFIPAMFARSLSIQGLDRFSLIVAGILIISYVLWLVFSMVTHKEDLADEVLEEHQDPHWSKARSIFYLLLATIIVAFVSEWLVSTLEAFTHRFGFTELFVGAFIIAIIGNAAEHSAAVMLAYKNKIGAAVEIAIGSSLQIALFVAPVLIIISWLFGNTMSIVFTTHEIVAIAVAVFISKSISQDGKSNWFEGILLLVVYFILAVAFYFV